MTGELGSDRLKTKEIEDDLKEYKNVAKQYTDQLIKVKVSKYFSAEILISNTFCRCRIWRITIWRNIPRR